VRNTRNRIPMTAPRCRSQSKLYSSKYTSIFLSQATSSYLVLFSGTRSLGL